MTCTLVQQLSKICTSFGQLRLLEPHFSSRKIQQSTAAANYVTICHVICGFTALRFFFPSLTLAGKALPDSRQRERCCLQEKRKNIFIPCYSHPSRFSEMDEWGWSQQHSVPHPVWTPYTFARTEPVKYFEVMTVKGFCFSFLFFKEKNKTWNYYSYS